MLLGILAEHGADDARLAEPGMGRLVPDQFDAGDQADSPDLADQVAASELAQPRLEPVLHAADMGADIHLAVDLLGLDGDGRGDRMAGIGIAVAERADPRAGLDHGGPDFLVHQQGRDRQVGGRQRLRRGNHVRLDIEGLAAPGVAGAVEAADHLVDDHEDVVFLQNGLHLREIAGRRHDHAAGPHDRFGEHAADCFRTLIQNQFFQVFRAS